MKKLYILFFVTSMPLLFACKKECNRMVKDSVKIEEATKLEAKFSFTVADQYNIFENQTIVFNNLSTGYDKFVWEFGNNTKSQLKNPETSFPVHGYYTVKLTVFDKEGQSQAATQDINILCNFAPGTHTGTGVIR